MKSTSLRELIECAELLFSDADGKTDKRQVDAMDHYLQGLVHSADGDKDGALSSYEKAIVSDPNDYILQLSVAELLENKGRIEEAKGHYRIAADLRDAGAGRQEATATTEPKLIHLRKRMDDVLVLLSQKVVDTNPSSHAYHGLGVALCNIGRLDEGVAAMKKSIEMRPDSIFTYYELAKALEKQGKQEEAGKYRQIFDDIVKPAGNGAGK